MDKEGNMSAFQQLLVELLNVNNTVREQAEVSLDHSCLTDVLILRSSTEKV